MKTCLNYTITESQNMKKPIIGVSSWQQAAPANLLKAIALTNGCLGASKIFQALDKILFEPTSPLPISPISVHNTNKDSGKLNLNIFRERQKTPR